MRGVPVAIRPILDTDPVVYGLMVGLIMGQDRDGCDRCESDLPVIAVQLDGHGMCLSLFHPSRVVLIEPR